MAEEIRCVELAAHTGRPCRVRQGLARDSDGKVRCRWHSIDEDRQMVAYQQRSKGGRAKRVPPAPESPEDAKRFLAWVMHALAAGKIDKGQAEVLGKLADKFLQAADAADTDRKLAELKALGERIMKGRDT